MPEAAVTDDMLGQRGTLSACMSQAADGLKSPLTQKCAIA